MPTEILRASLLDLIRRTSVDLPADIESALAATLARERPASPAAEALRTILDNVALARSSGRPLCQDTGAIHFFIACPPGFDAIAFESAARDAVARATAQGLLRANCVDAVSGRNTGDNCGPGSPQIHLDQQRHPEVTVRLLLKGGGSENVSRQYSLPDARLGDRTLAGVRACVLDAVQAAQGLGCPPGIVGVCIGGDRGSAWLEAKRQLLRPLGDHAPEPALAALETSLLAEVNRLGIGAMAFGGATTLLACKIGCLHRLPACFFVTIAYLCWACRRRGVVLDRDGAILRHLEDV